jgi:hypothetical protein
LDGADAAQVNFSITLIISLIKFISLIIIRFLNVENNFFSSSLSLSIHQN